MKRHISIIFAAALALTLSCEKAVTPENGTTRLTVSIDNNLKTGLGDASDGKRPVLWSEGDCISVNGVASKPLSAAQAGQKSATFDFDEVLNTPYNILYPASLSADSFVLPATQSYTEGSFDPAAAPLYGTGDNTAIMLANLCDILRFGFTGSEVLDRIVISSVGGEPVAGTVTMAKSSDKFTGAVSIDSNKSTEITYSFGTDGLALTSSAEDLFIPVIKGTYAAGFTVKVYTKGGTSMTLGIFGSGRTLEGSKVLLFPDKEFVAGAYESLVLAGEYGTMDIDFDLSGIRAAVNFPSDVTVPADAKSALVEITPGDSPVALASESVSVESEVAYFDFLADINSGKASYTYVWAYPYASVTIDGTSLVAAQPVQQTYTADGADILGAPLVAVEKDLSVQPSSLILFPEAIYATLGITLANLPADEQVLNVAFISNDAAITGDISVDLTDGSIASSFQNTRKSVNAKPAEGCGRQTSIDVTVIPANVTSWKASVVTDRHIYNWTSSSPVTFTAGSETTVTLDFNDATIQTTLCIFLIGNSFTQDACFRLPGVIVGAGITNVEVTQCYYGGRTVPEYNNGWETSSDYTKHTALPGETEMTNTSNANLKTVAESGRWDIVTIQEHTGNYRAWSWNETEKNHIRGLMEKVAATQEVRPQFYYIMSQTYYNMGKIGSGSVPYITWTDQAGMYDVTVAFAKKVMEEIPFVNVIATGTTLQNLRQTHLVNSMCLTRDGYHMDYGISRYAAACCLYQTMLYPRYRVPLSENTFRISDSSTADGSYTTPVTDENAPIAQQAALDAVAHPFEITFREFDYGGSGAAGGSLSGKDQGTL